MKIPTVIMIGIDDDDDDNVGNKDNDWVAEDSSGNGSDENDDD